MQTLIQSLVKNYINNHTQGQGSMTTSWYKLKDDSWGIKIKDGTGVAGQEIDVTNSKGETKTIILNARTAKFEDAELWSVQ